MVKVHNFIPEARENIEKPVQLDSGHSDNSADIEKLEAVQLEDAEGHLRPQYTKEEEEEVMRKLDWYLMPLIFVLYSLSVLDRSNLGNARIAGLAKDINLTGRRYDWLATVFYIACTSRN
jgi:hypothetical protein